MVLSHMVRSGLFGLLFTLAVLVPSSDMSGPTNVLTVVPRHRHRPIVIHERRAQTLSSYNWSGYAVTAAMGAVTDVKGS